MHTTEIMNFEKEDEGSNDLSQLYQDNSLDFVYVWHSRVFFVLSCVMYCYVCSFQSNADELSCPMCHATSHIVCLARHFLSQREQQHGFLLPINGSCPLCSADLLWGDLIRYKRGCYQEELSNAPVAVHFTAGSLWFKVQLFSGGSRGGPGGGPWPPRWRPEKFFSPLY